MKRIRWTFTDFFLKKICVLSAKSVQSVFYQTYARSKSRAITMRWTSEVPS